jgi:integrase
MLFERKDSKYYWYRFTINGKRIQRSTGTSDKKKAQEIADKAKAQAWGQIKHGEKHRYLWQDAVIRWINENGNKKSIEDDKYMLVWLRPYLDDKYLDEISKDVIEKIIQEKLKTTSGSRVNRVTSLLGAILNKATNEWDWIDTVPHIRKFKEPKKRIRWLTQDEVRRLMVELPAHLIAMARFSLLTGLRESNVTRLEWRQIDMQRRVAWIHPDQAKTGNAIGIPLNNQAIQVLRSQMGKHQVRVFTYKSKPVEKAGTKAWRDALERAGIENFRWHDLRHTWASWHVQNGTPLHILKELGGWSSYDMVQRYAHLAPEHLAEYANKFSEIETFFTTDEKVTTLKVT